MTADYSSEIKIAIFQSFRNANVPNEDRRQIVVKLRANRGENCAF